MTLNSGLSLVEQCLEVAEATGDASLLGIPGTRFFGPITTFFSYSWHGGTFAELVEALEARDANKHEYYFVDIMVVAQNRTRSRVSTLSYY